MCTNGILIMSTKSHNTLLKVLCLTANCVLKLIFLDLLETPKEVAPEFSDMIFELITDSKLRDHLRAQINTAHFHDHIEKV